MSTLSEYITDTRRLLRDSQGIYWSDPELISYINQGMKQRDIDSGQNRLLQTVPLVAGQNMYTINTGSFSAATVDVMGIIVLVANTRLRLGERVYAEAASQFQPTTTYTGWPQVFAKFGAASVYIAPAPNQAYDAEWDTCVVSPALSISTDADPLPYPWTEPVPYHAASLARYALQQYDEAEQMKKEYMDILNGIAGGVRGAMVPYPYSTSRNRT